ncbi:sigma-70 family RNA polymerase sigma factor [Kitasatospora sp. NPDC001527]|uniref:sigma-70 family RNA polymerase sigma factor n=1 Tax=Kitasatospora sp. NPDC001527 TaxID=3154519 RepID=UPI0033190682
MTTSTEGPRDAVLAAYERQVDGLFTYCLSVLCEHEAAAAALREVRELAVRYGGRLAEPGLVRAWLYSLARYCCLRRLADGAGNSGTGGDGAGGDGAEAVRRRRELASLTWPEAAGTDPEQREALELSVRHRLTPIEVAAVLGQPFEAVRVLLASARAEVDRTRAALLVLGAGNCPELDRLGGAGAESWRDWVLGPALRRELVRHVVDCPTCRGTAERIADEVPRDGAAGLSGLPVIAAPPGGARLPARPVAYLPGTRPPLPHPPPAARERAGRRAGAPGPVTEPGLRFDQGGFPRHRAPEAGRGPMVRRRVVTTGVLAAVLAAPVVALWAGHRGGGGPGTAAVSSVRVEEDRPAGGRDADPAGGPDGPGGPGGPVGTAGAVGAAIGALGGAHRGSGPAVAGMELAGARPLTAETLQPGIQGPLVPVPAYGAAPLGSPALIAAPTAPVGTPGAGASPSGLLTVEAGEYGSRTVLTLTNSGGTDIHWHAVVDAPWLRLSRDAGTLAPGQRITVIANVDEDLAPATRWTARIALPPSQAVVTLEGGPQHRGGATPSPVGPSPVGPSTAGPTPAPSGTPTGGAPAPSATPTPTTAPSATGTPGTPGTPGTTPSASPTPSATPSTGPTAPASPGPSPSGTAEGPASPAPH